MTARLRSISERAERSGSLASMAWLTVWAPIVTRGSSASPATSSQEVVDRVGADRDERIVRKPRHFVPGHAQFLAEGRDVDPIAGAEIAHDLTKLLLGLEAAHPAIELVEQVPLLGHGAAFESLLLAVDQEADALVAGDDRFEREPPQFAEPVGEARRDVDGERHLVALEDGIGPLQGVAVAVVNGDADEAPLKVALDEATMHLVEADEIEPCLAQIAYHVFEEARRHFEQPVGLEPL